MLKRARLKKKYTQSFLSKKTGISQGYISKLETSNKHSPTLREVLLLAKALDICPLTLAAWFMLNDTEHINSCCINCFSKSLALCTSYCNLYNNYDD